MNVRTGVSIHWRTWGLGFCLTLGEEAFVTLGPVSVYAYRVHEHPDLVAIMAHDYQEAWQVGGQTLTQLNDKPVNRG